MTDKPQQYPKMTYEQLEDSHSEWKKTAMDNYGWAKYEEKRADEATERHAAASRDRDAVYKKLGEAESLIQQKDAEIARLRSAIEKSIAEYELHEEPGAAAECMWQILYTHGQPEHASLLQGKGDKL
ncbi:hypothetical protein [Paenibacillus peoriae]|uniref:Uncharacterized protein n=1 Tax=Paenibacillus peoriae TaxID=59893 RepID=A0ABU1Q9I7_9BACL|nr:hypothetical protein [Paenibacillus peoriae]MDR6776290.1 hypothetical protein [Paenibacillus peoriae]OMF46575.1 hypothetical protein BK135_12125 [Paenibacillus peoriae]